MPLPFRCFNTVDIRSLVPIIYMFIIIIELGFVMIILSFRNISGGGGGGSNGYGGNSGGENWTCSCGVSNFASRFKCFKCYEPKPGGGE
jgi:Zn-finger in Ran binding protein and others.